MSLRMFGVLLVSLLSIAALSAHRAGAAPPATSPSEKPLVYTLEDSNGRRIDKPTADQIKTAVATLDGEKVLFLCLRSDGMHFIQANWDARNQLVFQYQAGDEQHLYETPKRYPAEVAIKLLVSYMSGKDDWKKMVEWEPMK